MVDIQKRIHAELSALESRAELRQLRMVHGIDFSSNDYLGLATDPRMKQAIAEGVEYAARIASTGSRLLSGQSDSWTLAEQNFAKWAGTEAALYFTSGYAANVGLLSSVLRPEDVVFSDSANHASIIDGIRLSKCKRVIFPHLDLQFLEKELQRNTSQTGARVIVVESLFSMEGDFAPLGDLEYLAETYGAELIVDEAHAIGVRGPHGSGCVAGAGLSRRVLATVHTCGKALASAGAFVCGSESLRNFLINRARTFVFNTAMPPYFASQVSAGVTLARDANAARARLGQLSEFLKCELRENGFYISEAQSHIVPIVLGLNAAAVQYAEFLNARGFGVRAIRPPTVPEGKARLRISLTAKHSEDILAEFVLALVQARNEYSTSQAASVSR